MGMNLPGEVYTECVCARLMKIDGLSVNMVIED